MLPENQPPSPQGEGIDPEKLTFVWGMVSLPISDTPANFFVTGGSGSGKTITLRLLMQSVLGQIGFGLDHRAIVYDAKGTMKSLLHGMDLRCPLHILNPFDGQGEAWDIAADIDSPSAADQMATFLLPMDMSAQPFFADAGRQLLTAVCMSLIKTAPGKWSLRDVLLAVQNRERLLSLLAGASETTAAAQSYINDERLCTNVLATIATKLQPFEVIAAQWQHATNKLSLQRWLHDESVILVGDNPRFHSSVAPINQAIFGCLADLILSQKNSAARRTWIFLDDACYAGRLAALPALMQQGRSQGVCVALGAQDIVEIRRLYGPQAAEEITASCSHITALRTDNPEAAAWAERHFGPPLRAYDLISLPPTGPAHGFTAFHHTPKTGTYLANKSWDWVLAKLQHT